MTTSAGPKRSPSNGRSRAAYATIPVAMLVEIVVVLLAVARLTRLVTADEITRPVRETAARRLRDGNPLLYLLFCRWCLSAWIAVPAAAGWWNLSDVDRWSSHWWVDVTTVALALSYAAGPLVAPSPRTSRMACWSTRPNADSEVGGASAVVSAVMAQTGMR